MGKQNQLKSVWLQENKWSDIKKYLEQDDRILIPIGSTEQHAFHLPLGTDSFVAIKLAEDVAKKANILITPPIWFGWSPHHLVLPGSVSIDPRTLSDLLYDIIKSLNEHGFKKFVVINGHRLVNISWMQISAERCQRELGVKVVIFDPAYMEKEITGNWVLEKSAMQKKLKLLICCTFIPILLRWIRPWITNLSKSVCTTLTQDQERTH
jgi:creatinine amidohydrolase